MKTAFSLIALLACSPVLATKSQPPEQDQQQDQAQAQEQQQSQVQDQNQAQNQTASASSSSAATSTANNSGVNNSTKVYAAGASSGNSSSTCQKVRDVRLADGFLFGLRWDMTDKDCRRLDVADQAYARGDTYFGDTLTCTVPFVLEAFGGDVDACKTSLERNDVVTAMQDRLKTAEAENQRLRADRERLLIERQYDREECDNRTEKLEEACTK